MDIRNRGQSGYRYQNWGGNVTCKPELYFEPKTEDELRQILVCAAEGGRSVKVIGGRHSMTDLPCTTDFMINMCNFNKVLAVDKNKRTMKVQAGSMIEDLCDTALPENGLAFCVLPILKDITVAGAISTGTHGTGANFKNMASYVLAVELMTASGEILEISGTKNKDLLPAARIAFGSLGILLSVTIQCETAFNLKFKSFPSNVNSVMENLDANVKSSEHFSFMWYPHTDDALCMNFDRTTKEAYVENGSWFWDILIGHFFKLFLLFLGTFITRLIPYVNRMLSRVQARTTEKIDRSDNVFCMYFDLATSSEWFVPGEHFPAAFQTAKEWIEKTNAHIPFPVCCRIVKSDTESLLSPAYGNGVFWTISFVTFSVGGRMPEYKSLFKGLETILLEHGARPHWAKEHTCTPSDFQKLYPKWNAFCDIREKLDPHGIFLNSHLEGIFGKQKTY